MHSVKNIFKSKAVLIIAAAAALALALIFAIGASRPSMRWARALKASDIAKIELVVMPSGENERYRLFDEGEYGEIVEVINACRASAVSNPESLAGGSEALYITLADGAVHRIVNTGNCYLIIDGDYYSPTGGWLERWKQCGFDKRGDAKLPNGFSF